jgi:cytochrome c peroxidase
MVITHYNNVAFAIAAYEGSSDVNQFSSKYDDVMRKTAKFTPEEAEGYRIIQSSQVDNCGSSGCHKEKENGVALFTDFGYENIGLPWKDAYRKEDGLKRGDVDQGLYATIISNPNKNNLNMAAAREHIGTFKTPTLRNVARGENSNGAGKGKRFMHNGIFRTLEEVIHFYNTRSVPGEGWNTKTNTAAKGEGWRPWGTPEYAATMADNDEVGKLGLSARQEKAIVAFLRTLNDTRDVLPPPPYSGAVTPVQIAN